MEVETVIIIVVLLIIVIVAIIVALSKRTNEGEGHLNRREYYSFAETLTKLNLNEEGLKQLVAEGEIRAYRDGMDMRFKKSEVDVFKSG